MIFLGNINLMSMIFLWNIIMMIIDCYPIHQDKKCDPDYLPQMIMMIISPVNLDIIWSHNYENYDNPDDHDVSCSHDHCYHCDPDNYGLSLY